MKGSLEAGAENRDLVDDKAARKNEKVARTVAADMFEHLTPDKKRLVEGDEFLGRILREEKKDRVSESEDTDTQATDRVIHADVARKDEAVAGTVAQGMYELLTPDAQQRVSGDAYVGNLLRKQKAKEGDGVSQPGKLNVAA